MVQHVLDQQRVAGTAPAVFLSREACRRPAIGTNQRAGLELHRVRPPLDRDALQPLRMHRQVVRYVDQPRPAQPMCPAG